MFSSPGMPNTQVTPSCSRHWTRSSAARRGLSATTWSVLNLDSGRRHHDEDVSVRAHLSLVAAGEHKGREPALDESGAHNGRAGTNCVTVVDGNAVVPCVTGEDATVADRLHEPGLVEEQLPGLIDQSRGHQPDAAEDRFLRSSLNQSGLLVAAMAL